jgi:hypothetical protein
MMARAGDVKQAVKLARMIDVPYHEEPEIGTRATLWVMTVDLVTQRLSEEEQEGLILPLTHRLKRTFTPKEKQRARQLVQSLRGG